MTPATYFDGPRKDIEDLARAKFKAMWRPHDLQTWNCNAQRIWREICRFIRRPAAREQRILGDLSDLIALMLVLTELINREAQEDHFKEPVSPAEDMLAKCLAISRAKNHDYAGEGDFANNFIETGRRIGIRPIQTWLAYADKHWCSVTNFVICGKLESEPIADRIADVINYCCLLFGMVVSGVAIPESQPKFPS